MHPRAGGVCVCGRDQARLGQEPMPLWIWSEFGRDSPGGEGSPTRALIGLPVTRNGGAVNLPNGAGY